MDLDLIAAARENGRAAMRAETAPLILTELPVDCDRRLREDGRGMEQGAMMFAAIHAMAQPHPVRPPGRLDPQPAALAAAGDFLHGLIPQINETPDRDSMRQGQPQRPGLWQKIGIFHGRGKGWSG